jgi:hypothetical protein
LDRIQKPGTYKDKILSLDGLLDLALVPQFGLDDLDSQLGKLLGGVLGRVPGDGSDTVRFVALEEVTEDAAALDTGRSEDGDRGCVGVGGGYHCEEVFDGEFS